MFTEHQHQPRPPITQGSRVSLSFQSWRLRQCLFFILRYLYSSHVRNNIVTSTSLLADIFLLYSHVSSLGHSLEWSGKCWEQLTWKFGKRLGFSAGLMAAQDSLSNQLIIVLSYVLSGWSHSGNKRPVFLFLLYLLCFWFTLPNDRETRQNKPRPP